MDILFLPAKNYDCLWHQNIHILVEKIIGKKIFWRLKKRRGEICLLLVFRLLVMKVHWL